MDLLFAVRRTRGACWDAARPLEQQEDWAAHAAFMNGLAAEGFVVLGGPLEGTAEVLLIVRAPDADTVRSRLGEDCWARQDLLRVLSVVPWSLRLGADLLEEAGQIDVSRPRKAKKDEKSR